MLKLTSILINSSNVEDLKKFYTEVLGPEMEGMGGWVIGDAYMAVLEHSEVKGENTGVSRVMFNLETTEVKEEFDRISKVDGVKVIAEPYQMEGFDGWIATLADPDGNYFQLVTPWDENNQTN